MLMYAILLVQMLYVFAGNTLHEILGIIFLYVWYAISSLNEIFPSFFSGVKTPVRKFSDAVTVLLLYIIVLMVSSMGVSRFISMVQSLRKGGYTGILQHQC